MGQTNLNIRMDEDLKRQFEVFCSDVGMNMTTAVNMFVKIAVRERKIPFEISAASDPFYSESNINHLRKVTSDIENNTAKYVVKTLDELEEMANE